VATKRQVERKLRELMQRLEQSGGQVRTSLAGALPESRVIEVVVSDLGLSYWTELSGGSMDSLHEGTPPHHEIRIRLSSDDVIELVDGRRSLFSAYLAGQVTIEASFSDLLRLRKLA
jgi:hypothetical protein